MVERVRPGVVRIETNLGSGSGIIFEAEPTNGSALVLTNYHVIEGASWVDVIVNDSTTYTGTVRGVDSNRDLAVVRICCGNFGVLPFGDGASLEVGSEVVAIGYALGIPGRPTVTRGIVSAVRYDPDNSRWVIQTDAPINPGNSGGPLFSLDGEVVGVNTFTLVSTVGGSPTEGLGFAVSEVTVKAQCPPSKAEPWLSLRPLRLSRQRNGRLIPSCFDHAA
jgi:serine protease Do